MIQSLQYDPNPALCCERCIFGTGEHAGWCEMTAMATPEQADEWKFQASAPHGMTPAEWSGHGRQRQHSVRQANGRDCGECAESVRTRVMLEADA